MRPESKKTPRYSKAALRAMLQLCAAGIFVCVLAVGIMNARRTTAEQRNALATQGIQAARARLDRVNERRALIDKYQNRYEQLVSEGLTIRFDRSVAGDWFDMAIRAVRAGAVDNYVIGKDAPFVGPETAELTAFRVVSHRLDFNASAADEDEFADLMSAVESHLPGTTAQEACSLTRTASSESAPRLALHCALVWYEFTPSNTVLSANLGGT